MFGPLKDVVEILIASVKVGRELKKEADRETFVVDVLSVYFLLKDTVEEGETLIVSAGSNPAGKIKSLSDLEADKLIKEWDAGLRRQANRLYQLQGMVVGQDALAVIAPEFQEHISRAIGNKATRVVSLHGIGSALVIRVMFGLKETPEQIAKLVAFSLGQRSCNLDLIRIRQEVAELRRGLEEYRALVESLASKEEIARLSKKARKLTQAADNSE